MRTGHVHESYSDVESTRKPYNFQSHSAPRSGPVYRKGNYGPNIIIIKNGGKVECRQLVLSFFFNKLSFLTHVVRAVAGDPREPSLHPRADFRGSAGSTSGFGVPGFRASGMVTHNFRRRKRLAPILATGVCVCMCVCCCQKSVQARERERTAGRNEKVFF